MVQHSLFKAIFLVATLLFATAIFSLWIPNYSWHDQQRLLQLLLILAALPLYYSIGGARLLPTPIVGLLGVLFISGFIASLMAEYPIWALREWGRYLGLLLLTITVAHLCRSKAYWYWGILALLTFALFFNGYQFLVYYLMAFLTNIKQLEIDLLFNGFSNPRFLNQFQQIAFPLVAALFLQLLRVKFRYRNLLLLLIGLTLITQWALAYGLGGRGLWAGLLFSHLITLIILPRYWPLLIVQAAAAGIGSLLFLLLFDWIPAWAGIEPTIRSSLRFGLSMREVLWRDAWELFLANPLFGAGPMHFSAIGSSSAHPHQVLLQWLSEWGGIATIAGSLIVFIGGGYLYRLLKTVPEDNPLLGGGWLAILGALLLAQVDGVFVMPYTETWLALLIGLMLGRWGKSYPALFKSQRVVRSLRLGLLLPPLLIFTPLLIYEAPTLPQELEAHWWADHAPRFWIEGRIPFVRDEADY